MTVDYIRYDILTQDALRGVVRTVLADVAVIRIAVAYILSNIATVLADIVSVIPHIARFAA